MEKVSCLSSGNDLPDDLLVEILKRVWSVKRLCGLRCVCKSWNSLISSPSFIIAHHNRHSAASDQISQLVLKRESVFFIGYAFYHPGQGGELKKHGSTFIKLVFKNFPFRTRDHSPPKHFIAIDVIHGVVCLIYSPSSPTILWNPTIHKYVEIPPPPPFEFSNKCCYALFLGFGFDRREDDFRVVRLWMPKQYPTRRGRRRQLVCQVFSLQKHIWGKAVGSSIIRHGKLISKVSLFFNGTIHWIISAYKQNRDQLREFYTLLMFDCEQEEFTKMRLPRAFNRPRNEILKLMLINYQGMLSIVFFTSATVQMWVMEKYGVASTWKELTFQQGYHHLFSES